MRTPSSLLFFPAIFFICFSCNNKPSIVGKWIPVGVDSKYVESYHLSVSDIEKMTKENSLELKQDGKAISIARHDTGFAIYNYNEKAKTLIIAPERDKSVKFTIDLEKNKMILSNEFGKMT